MHKIKSGTTIIMVVSALLLGLPLMALPQELTAPFQKQPAKTWRYAQVGVPTPPPTRRLVGRRQTASPRGCSPKGKELIALMPQTNLGLTLAPYPTFFFYIPPTSAKTVEFTLLDEETEDTIYSATFTITDKSGIFSVSLPANNNSPELKIGKNYHWYFSVICDSEDRAGDAYVEGWVQRVASNSTLMSELQKASLLERLAIYAKADIWQERLTTLAELRRLSPNDPNLAAKWANLLSSVGLDDIANEPLVVTHKIGGN